MVYCKITRYPVYIEQCRRAGARKIGANLINVAQELQAVSTDLPDKGRRNYLVVGLSSQCAVNGTCGTHQETPRMMSKKPWKM